MECTFTFDSDHFATDGLCNKIEVTIEVTAHCEDDFGHDITGIWDLTADVERDFESFPQNERAKIETMADDLASKNSYDAYQDYLQSAGDAMYESMKDE